MNLWWRHEAFLASDPSDLAAFSPGPAHSQPAPVGEMTQSGRGERGAGARAHCRADANTRGRAEWPYSPSE